jgi:hypothetical protein
MPRFVILTHDHPQLHWDLLLEQPSEERLRTWRLERPPESGMSISAEALPDHRRMYLDYEGPISGNRGEVSQWDHGDYEMLSQSPTEITLQLQGQQLNGEATLTQKDGNQWALQFVINRKPKTEN